MRKSLLAFAAFALMAGFAMAHGPPSALDHSVMAQASNAVPRIASGGTSVASDACSSCRTAAMHGGGSGGIPRMSDPAGHGAPRNERMLN